MPTAAKMASSSVGGSRRTRRVPYLVFQSSLIGGLDSDPEYLGSAMLHCNMNLMWQSSYALVDFTGLPNGSLRRFRWSEALRPARRARGRNCVTRGPRNAPPARRDRPIAR